MVDPHTCIVCFGTPIPSTQVAFRGSLSYLRRALVDGLNIEPDVADEMIRSDKRHFRPQNNPHAPMGLGKPATAQWYAMSVCLCPQCALRLNFDVATKADLEVPCYEEDS